MLRRILLTGLLTGLLAGGAVAQDMHGGMHHAGPGGHGYLGFLQGVTLTDAQQSQMHAILKSSWQQMKPQMQQLRALREQIGGDMASTATVNATQLVGLEQQAQTLQSQIDKLKLATAIQVRSLLTPDQLSQSATVHAQLAALHQQEHNVMTQSGASSAATPAQ